MDLCLPLDVLPHIHYLPFLRFIPRSFFLSSTLILRRTYDREKDSESLSEANAQIFIIVFQFFHCHKNMPTIATDGTLEVKVVKQGTTRSPALRFI